MKRILIILLCIAIFIAMQCIGAPASLNAKSWDMLCITTVMTILWISEKIELGVTALIPIVLFPVFGILPFKEVTLSYANETIFLFMGGFMLAIALERSRIHERIAMRCIRILGASPMKIMLGFMVVIAFLSMWVSNTAAILMIIPICTAIVEKIEEQAKPEDAKDIHKFYKAIYLSLAYAASIGGIGTLIGTPPNIVMASIINGGGYGNITFFQWMVFATPFAFFYLIIVWIILSYVVMTRKSRRLKIDMHKIDEELIKLGRMNTHEKRVGIVFLCVVILWITKDFINLPLFKSISDTTIAIAGAIVLFIVPDGSEKKESLLIWSDAAKLPWNILLLFGGGLALSKGFATSGLSDTIAGIVSNLNGIHPLLIILTVAVAACAMTELMSNTATATLLIPIGISVATGIGMSPYLLVIPITVASSLAFMLPISTPPNAIVFSYGYITVKDMAKIGLLMDVIALILVTLYCHFLIPIIF